MKITELKGATLALGIALSITALADNNLSDEEMATQAAFNSKALIDGSAGPGGTSIRYKNLAASGMKAQTQSFNYGYSGGGCMKANAPATYVAFDDMVDLPVGSKLVSLTLNTNPTSSTDTQSALLYQSLNGVFSTIAFASVSDDSIAGHTSDGVFLDHTLVTDGIITARLEVSGNTAEICSMRIGYISPDVASDVIYASNFYR